MKSYLEYAKKRDEPQQVRNKTSSLGRADCRCRITLQMYISRMNSLEIYICKVILHVTVMIFCGRRKPAKKGAGFSERLDNLWSFEINEVLITLCFSLVTFYGSWFVFFITKIGVKAKLGTCILFSANTEPWPGFRIS